MTLEDVRAGRMPGADEASTATVPPSVPRRPREESLLPNPADPEYFKKLAAMMISADESRTAKEQAVAVILGTRPENITDRETRQQIARNFRELANQARFDDDVEAAVRGLVIYGGRYSAPILVEMVAGERFRAKPILFDALAALKDPAGAKAVVNMLGNFFNHDEAVRAIGKMGSVAEDALIEVAPSNDAKISVAAVKLLGDVGTQKCVSLLRQAQRSTNPEVKAAAADALRKVGERQRSGQPIAADAPVDLFAMFSRPIAATRGQGGASSLSSNEALPKGDWSQVNVLLPLRAAGSSVPSDPSKEAVDANWQPRAITLGDAASRRERPVAMDLVSAGTPVALVVYAETAGVGESRFEYVDLNQGKLLAKSAVGEFPAMCFMSPSGTRAVVVGRTGRSDGPARLEAWKLGAEPARLATWWPYADGEASANEIKAAGWIDEDQLFTFNGDGTLVLWRLEGTVARAVYQRESRGAAATGAALSPGRAYLAVRTEAGADVLQAHDGKLLAQFAGARPGRGGLAFNMRGDRLACISDRQVCLWNLTSGAFEREFDVVNLRTGGEVAWLDDRHVLLDGKDVLDLSRRLYVCQFQTFAPVATTEDGRHWLVFNVSNAWGLVSTALLTPEVLANSAPIEAGQVLAVQPGAKVTLEVSIDGEQGQRADQALRAAIERCGMEVADGQPLRLRAQIVTGQTATEEYGQTAVSREQVSLTGKYYSVELVMDGKPLWKHAETIESTQMPGSVRTSDGETVQQMLDRRNAEQAASFSFDVTLPRYIAHPKFAGPLVKASIAADGIKIAETNSAD
jgi:hypothetical protein